SLSTERVGGGLSEVPHREGPPIKRSTNPPHREGPAVIHASRRLKHREGPPITRWSICHARPRFRRASFVPATRRLSFSTATQRGTAKKPQSGTAERRATGMYFAQRASRSAPASTRARSSALMAGTKSQQRASRSLA